ncbi:MAG: Lrp/AsnC family transcriptional regulator [Alphaproteobacteria bacterium]|nr:Lrp/AsnC family transcriptional regulator [Alphaproteobacteria bacterium]
MERNTPVLDEIDRRILVELQRDGRLTNHDLAGRIGVSASPCWRRVRALEEAGVIKGYAALVDPAALGLNVSVFTQVSLERQEKKALQVFEAAVGEWPEIMECYLMTGDADYLLRVVVPDLAAYERFLMARLTRIRGIASIKSSFALRSVKYRTDLPIA